MEKLKKLLMDLTNTFSRERQIMCLQSIGKELLNHYVIKLPVSVIQPLWIEAYYFDPDLGFRDDSVHKDERQQRYDVLYFHHKTDDLRSGVDLCLSPDQKCCLSFLLKYTLVNGVFTTQSQLSGCIPTELRNSDGVLSYSPNPTEIMWCAKRIGICSGEYKDEKLAIVRDFNQRFVTSDGQKESLPQKMELLRAYISATYPEEERSTDAQKAQISRKLVGEYWRELFL